ncbi:hypothetical protein PSHT_15368 [Puccinia striiformis]|uniref:Hydrophobin n=2 Tax=Puccinia striiformis TaxID=27350 RepID=A0A2S4UFK1_9BASI|nr:hypothetical protein PSHT_15368 [Puccinia striiformis]POW16622.1 hypothetical protein PSTT_01090 [Puccinia striiformis]
MNFLDTSTAGALIILNTDVRTQRHIELRSQQIRSKAVLAFEDLHQSISTHLPLLNLESLTKAASFPDTKSKPTVMKLIPLLGSFVLLISVSQVQGQRGFDCNNQAFKGISCITSHKRPQGKSFFNINGGILLFSKAGFEAGCRARNGVPGCCNDAGPRALNSPIQQFSMREEYPNKRLQIALHAGVVVAWVLRIALLYQS